MFNTIFNTALNAIFSLFLLAIVWSIFGETIKDFLQDIGIWKKK